MNGCVIFTTGMQRYREMCKFGESLISEKVGSNSELENYILHMFISKPFNSECYTQYKQQKSMTKRRLLIKYPTISWYYGIGGHR